jgi:quercetin dioxygenase-like cupin family protein
MKIFALLLSLFVLAPGGESPVPIEKEPRHRLRFENASVRLFDVLIPEGEQSLFHTHEHDGVGIKLSDARIRDEKAGGSAEELQVERGAVNFARFPEGLTHRVSNIGATPFRNMFIEILPSTAAPTDAPSLAGVPGHELVLENERVRIYRLVLAPGQSTETHRHALRGLGVALSDGEIAHGAPADKSKTVRFKTGDYLWHEEGTTHSLKNVGSDPFEAFDIELK